MTKPRYVRKTNQPYIRLTRDQVKAVEDWEHARRQLGSQKVLAARIGVSTARIQAVLAKLRRRARERNRGNGFHREETSHV